MKKSRLVGIATLFLALSVVGCGSTGGSKSGASSGACSHKWTDVKVIEDATCAKEGSKEQKCDKCGETRTTKISKKSHEWETKTETPATCTDAGSKVSECKNCHETKTETIEALGHDWADAADQTGATPATCTDAGTKIQECSRCHQKQNATVRALGHDWQKATDQSAATAPTCFEAGTEIEECSRCHDTRETEVAATGHTWGTPATVAHQGDNIAYQKEECAEGDGVRYTWAATEVTAASLATLSSEATDEQNAKEPEEGGLRFFGRCVGSKLALNEYGSSSEGAATEDDYDPTVEGDYFEFVFNSPVEIKGARLIADIDPAGSLSNADMFAAASGDWTVGWYFDEAQQKAVKYSEWRYLITNTVDGVKTEAVWDAGTKTSGGQRGWYNFPCRLDIAKGVNRIRIAMTGGWRHFFYHFGVQKDVKNITIDKANFVLAEGSSNKDGTPEGYMKLASNNQSFSVKFNAAAAGKAVLKVNGMIDSMPGNASQGFFNASSHTATPNFEITVNGGNPLEQTMVKGKSYADLGCTKDGDKAFSVPLVIAIDEITLVAGENTIVFKRLASYNYLISQVIIEL